LIAAQGAACGAGEPSPKSERPAVDKHHGRHPGCHDVVAASG